MDMEREREFLQEGMDLRFFLLRLLNSIWIVIIAALGGAAICAGGYMLYKQVNPALKEYRAETKYYIDFAEDSTGIGYGYYNDFTWNDFMKSNDILLYTLSLLPEGISQETVETAVAADIISDVRLLTITVTAGDRDMVNEIAQATAKSLVHYPEKIKEIDGIRVIREDTAKEVIFGDLTKNWCIFGMAAGFLISVFARWIIYCMDFSVYLPKDIEKRFGLSVLGVFYQKKKSGKEEEKESVYGRAEFDANVDYMLKGKKKIAVVTILGNENEEELLGILKGADSMGQKEIVYVGSYGKTDYECIRNADAGILCFTYGGKDSKLAERYLSDLKKQDCKITYAILMNANGTMYRRYYWGVSSMEV
ncbi:MAG: hypothetical protein K2K54_07165 [Lachnospiraceae bacterium]|nr:hypothetical protein [Lachnospiraceae bacterium]